MRAACWRARPRAYSGHQVPADGPPLHGPSDSPGYLIQRYASTKRCPVRVVGAWPSAWPDGLHHCPLLGPPMPLRLVSMMKWFPDGRADTASPYATFAAVPMKFD